MGEKPSTFDNLEDFGRFFLNFSAPFRFFPFFSFLLTLYDLCSHFEYIKPIFYDHFLPPPQPKKFGGHLT